MENQNYQNTNDQNVNNQNMNQTFGNQPVNNQAGRDKRVFDAISGAIWAVTVLIYVLVSFSTHAWHITWVIFLVGVAATNIVKAIMTK